jgi:hypothetical protein
MALSAPCFHGTISSYLLQQIIVVERRATILHLKIHVTARSKKLFCDGRIPFLGLDEQLCGPMRVLVAPWLSLAR